MCPVEPVGSREQGCCCVWCCRRRVVCCRASRVYYESWQQQPVLICGHGDGVCLVSSGLDVVRRRQAGGAWHASSERERPTGVLMEPLVFVY